MFDQMQQMPMSTGRGMHQMENPMNHSGRNQSHSGQNQEQNDLIIAHFSPDELQFMDAMQGGPSWMEIGDGQSIREYSALRDLPNDPQLRGIFEQAAMGDESGEMMPQGMARGGMPKGIPEDIEEIESHGRHGDSEVALIPMNLAQFFNELIDPSLNNKDHMPEYFNLGDTLSSIGSGLKSVGRFAGDTLATAAPYIGEGGGYLLGSMVGAGDLGSQVGGSLGRGLGRVAQGLWNQEGIPQSLGQGAYQAGATFLKPTLQKAAGMSPAQLNIDPMASPRDRAMPELLNNIAPLASSALGAIGGPVGAGLGAGLARAGTGYMNGESTSDLLRNGLKAGAWETGMPVAGNAVGAGLQSAFNPRPMPMSTPGLQTPQPQMAHGGRVNVNPYTGYPEYGFLKDIFKGVKRYLPVIASIAGHMIGGPMGAAIGGGIGGTTKGLLEGNSLGKSLGQGAISGGLSYAGSHLLGSLGGAGNMLGGATNMMGMGAGQGAGFSAIPSIAASEVGKMGTAQAMAPAAGSAASAGIGGIGSLLSNPGLPLAAMAGMSYMGKRDEHKRLKDWEKKEAARREKYEKSYGIFDKYKTPRDNQRRDLPYNSDEELTYGQNPGEHQFFENRNLFNKGGNVPGIGKGQQDNIDARLSPDEYVMDADSVAAFGDGSSRAGAMVLDKVRENLRKHKRHSVKGIPPKARPFENYMPVKSKKKFAGIGR